MSFKDIEILRDNDPNCKMLESLGYVLVGTSWGARLDLTEDFSLENLKLRIEKARNENYQLELLGTGYVEEIFNLEVLNNSYYPYTPATHQAMPTLESTGALFKPNSWNFGALYNKKLVAVCATSKRVNKTEIDFGSVHPDHKGKGIGIGLAAYALQTLINMGERHFSTGGAEVNSSSKATVEKLGFKIDEIWHSYQKHE
jgi:GNAT superfamily N-acetyltransferase